MMRKDWGCHALVGSHTAGTSLRRPLRLQLTLTPCAGSLHTLSSQRLAMEAQRGWGTSLMNHSLAESTVDDGDIKCGSRAVSLPTPVSQP